MIIGLANNISSAISCLTANGTIGGLGPDPGRPQDRTFYRVDGNPESDRCFVCEKRTRYS